MTSLNKVMLIGRLGTDPDLNWAGDTPVCNLSLATNRQWKDRQTGETKEATEWHRCTVWGKQAESCAKYLSKGSLTFIEGSLQTRKWTDNEGNDRYSTEVRANRVQFLDSRTRSESTDSPAQGFSDDDIPMD